MAFPSVGFTKPSSSLFEFPPSPEPMTLFPPAPGSFAGAPPFAIPAEWYHAVFDVRVPVTIASVYAVTVILVNRYNKANGNKPWAISKTTGFFWFVVLHNVLLAVYSAWTFVGMFKGLYRTVASPLGPGGLVATVDSLCKMHGTAGLGHAITYAPASSQWISQSPSSVLLSEAGAPFSTQTGRLWNEGLAFYGWFFYLSKFYEVLDTVIILAKGKRSSTLQTYHHSGAMMCMWAGIRFMAPPIWMFVLVNSFIHSLMYTYYTLTAFSVPIPQRIKRSLTTMQIMQFLVGASYAVVHSFITYTIPVSVPITKAAASSVVSSSATATATAALGSFIDKLLARASETAPLIENLPGFRTEYREVNCVDTSGQTWAIWLNVFYLTPLTFLFMRFFVKSYLRRGTPKPKANGHANGSANGSANGKVVMNGNGHAINGKVVMNGNGRAVNGKKH